jgi:pimeloyl-ACP methyl ester carboxylesterase
MAGKDPTRVYLHGLGASSPVYFGQAAAHPALTGHRSMLVDLLGFGISDRPKEFDYSLEAHAEKLAALLDGLGIGGAHLIAHSMGGAVAIALAASRPDLVSNLVLVDSNLDPATPDPRAIGSRGIAHYSEQDFLDHGFAKMRTMAGPEWWATMRLADPLALHRTAVGLVRGTTPTMRELLMDLPMPRTFLIGDQEDPLGGRDELVEAGVEVVVIPGAGHNIMLDTPDAFAEATAAALAHTG